MQTNKRVPNISRLESKEELDEVINIWLEVSKEAHYFIEFNYWVRHVNVMKETYIPLSETWIYKEPFGQIAGFVSLAESRLAAIFIRPENQQQGIGGRLINKAKQLREHLELAVYLQNAKAIRFYERHGFVAVGKSINQDTSEEELMMSWSRTKPFAGRL